MSPDLQPYFEEALASLDFAPPMASSASLLKQYCRLNLSCERPASRQAAIDSLFFLIRENPSQFLWIDLINLNSYLIPDRNAIKVFDNAPPWNDSTTAVGAFWQGCASVDNSSADELFQLASRHTAELDSLANTLLKRKLAGGESRHARHNQAAKLLLSELATARATGGPDLELLLWQDTAWYLTNGGHLDDALRAAVMAMALAGKAESSFKFTESRMILAEVLAARQETQAAQQQWDLCFAEAETADFPFLAVVSLSQAAALASTLGDHERAIRYNRKALERHRAEGDWFNEPRTMVNIADDYRRLGNPDSSLAILQRVHRMVHDSGSAPLIAEFPVHEAEHYSFVGDYARAESLLAEAGELIPEFSPTRKEAAFLAAQLQVALESDNLSLAFRTIARIQEMGDRFFDERVDLNVLADLEIATADLLTRQGEFRRAATALERARSLIEQGGGQDKEWELHRSLGELATLREDPAAARTAYSQCLEIALREDNQDLATRSRFGLGWTLISLGEFEKVKGLYQGTETSSAFGGRFRTYLAKELLLGVACSREGKPSTAIGHFEAALARCNEHSPPFLVARLRAERGLALIDLGHLPEGEDELLSAQKLLARSTDAFQTGEWHTFDTGTVRAVAEQLLSLWFAHPELMGEKDPAAAALYRTAPFLWQTRTGSRPYREGIGGDGSLVLAFFVGRHQSFIWAVNGDRTSWTALPGRAELLDLLQPVLFDLVRPGRPVDGEAMQCLANVLLGPVKDSWTSGLELRVFADDILWSVPWLALPWPDYDSGDARSLVMDKGNVWVLPGWPIVDSQETGDGSKGLSGDPSLLAVGYDGDKTPSGIGSRILRQAEKEALKVAEFWPLGPTEILVGEKANWAGMTDLDLGRFRVIHISSHVIAHQGAPEQSTLSLGDGPDEPPLTIPDIQKLDLGAELVFLSCCEAARPLSQAGGGVSNFADAFMQAGALAVIASGQKVDDQASAFLASRFYDYWLDGRDKAAALRAALGDLREHESWEHPFFWGNYRIIGY